MRHVVGRATFAPITKERVLPPGEVTLHQPDHPRLATNLLTILQRERELRVTTLAQNVAKDYADYRQHCGVIEGLDIAIAAAKEAQKKAEA